MQGKLAEIDIRSILQLIELGQRTGELFVEAYPTLAGGAGSTAAGVRHFWLVFFLNGQIIYATDKSTHLSRLSDYLRRYKAEKALNDLEVATIASTLPEYDALWALLEKQLLTPAQGRAMIEGMVQETLFDLLSLHQGTFVFELSSALAPQLTTLEISPLLAQTVKQVQEWKQLYPLIQSPDQCPTIAHPTALKEAIAQTTFNALDRYADAKTSIRQISRYLNRDILTVARAIYPYVQQSIIQMGDRALVDAILVGSKPPSIKELDLWQTARTARIVCIDDGRTIRETIAQILQSQGYETWTVENPLDALSQVFQIKPDLILCDISMPELDGYQLCAMLRESTAFRQIPIVMLTGRDGFIDRVRARIVGATDYLTKPFGATELLTLVEKYIGPGVIKPSPPLGILDKTGKDELEEDQREIERSIATSPSPTTFN
jgi:twitching motility two-component system response regulator PilG